MDNSPGAVDDLQRLYRDSIRRHATEPVGYRRAIEATHRHEADNPLCGDRIEVMLKIAGGRIEAAAFDGEACAICMASASLLCEHVEGLSPGGLENLAGQLEQGLEGRDGNEWSAEFPRQLAPLQGVRPYPSRIRCATLPWSAAVTAVQGETG